MTSKRWRRYNVSIWSENRCRKHDVVATLDLGRSNNVGKTTLWQRCYVATKRQPKTNVVTTLCASCCFNRHMHKIGPRGSKHYIIGNHFYSKNARKLSSMYSSILMLENIWYHHLNWSASNSQEIANLFQFNFGPRGPTIGTNSQFLVNSVHFR